MSSLFLVTTPIGNIDDITLRALRTLFSVPIIACEDTRITGKLIQLLKEKYHTIVDTTAHHTFLSYRDTNEEQIVPEIIQRIDRGSDVALVCDAGTPLISDPGYRIVQTALKRGIPVKIIPGVTAFITALSGSGLPVNTITFVGYLPEKQGKRVDFLKKIFGSHTVLSSTYITYVAPHKLIKTLEDMLSVFGDIQIGIARELTKLHEEFFRGSLNECLEHFAQPQGEFVVLFTLPDSFCNPKQ